MLRLQATALGKQLLAWLNAHTHSLMRPARKISSLWSGVAYLCLLSKLSPSLDIGAMIPDPTERFEAVHNFRIVESMLRKLGIEVSLDISKLTDGSLLHNIRLLNFIRDTFKQNIFDSVRIASPTQETSPCLAKERKVPITDEELSKALEKFRAEDKRTFQRPIGGAKHIFSPRISFQSRLTNIPQQDREDDEDDDGHLSQRSTISDLCSNVTTQQQKPLINCQAFSRLEKSKLKLGGNEHRTVNRLIYLHLQSLHGLTEFQNEFNSILENYKQLGKRATSLEYLFCGNKAEHFFSNTSGQKDGFEGARNIIRNICIQYFESIAFLKKIIKSSHSCVESKVKIIENLPNMIQLARMKEGQYNLTNSCQNVNQYQCWSIHKRTLIAFQISFIHKKESKYKYPGKNFNQKSFLFWQEQNHIGVNVEERIKALPDTYKCLHQIFQRDENQCNGLHRLKRFVKMMLYLKHQSNVGKFMALYDSIVENIKDIQINLIINFDEVYFMGLVNSLVERMKSKATYLDDYLVSQLGMSSDVDAVLELIQVTTYCFLADFFSLNFNAFHQQNISNNQPEQRAIRQIAHREANQKSNIAQFPSISSKQILCPKYSKQNMSEKNQVIYHLNSLFLKFVKKTSNKEGQQATKIKVLMSSTPSSMLDPNGLLQYYLVGNIKKPIHTMKLCRETAETRQQLTCARTKLGDMLSKYSRSFQFIHNLMSFSYFRKKSILMMFIKSLSIIELLPKIQWNFAQLFELQSYQEDKYLSEGNSEQRCQKQEHFWSQHRIVLIAYEAIFIIGQDVKKLSKYNQNKITKFSAFMLKKKVKMTNQATIQQRALSCAHLKGLFNHKNHQRLCQFVIGMLQLKNPSIIDHFLLTYDINIGEIIDVGCEQFYNTAGRFRIINEILEKLTQCGEKIADFLVQECGFALDLEGMMGLLRVTVYCFIAEMYKFTHNEFYCEAFTFDERTEKQEFPLYPQGK